MGVVKRDGDRWQYRFDAPRGADGKRRQVRRRGFRTQKEAGDALRTAERAAEGGVVAPARMTVGDLLDRWLESVKGRVSPATYRSYDCQIRLHLRPRLGGVLLSAFNALHVEEFKAGCARDRKTGRRGDLSARSVHYQFRILSMAMRQAVRWGLLQRNPCDAVTAPQWTMPEARSLTAEAAREMLEALAGDWLYLPALLSLAAGLRRGEVCGLRWEDVDFERGAVIVRHSAEKVGGQLRLKEPKGKRIGAVSIPGWVVAELRLARALAANEWVVPGPDGGMCAPHLLTGRFRAAARRLGINATFHTLRHTQGTVLLGANIHPRVIQARLRHRDMSMVEHYTHVQPAMTDTAAEQVGDLIRPRRPE